MADDRLTIVYDGDCPFCSNFVRLTRLREAAGSVALVNARMSDDPLVQDLQRRGVDLDRDMAVLLDGKLFTGGDAISVLARLSSAQSVFARLANKVLAKPSRAVFLYPLLRLGRRITLTMLGAPGLQRGDRPDQ